MTTDEIVSRLDCVLHHPHLSDICEDCEATKETEETLTAAIQAVELLEQIKEELQGNCSACKHREKKPNEQPCKDCSCVIPSVGEWEFRWPLGKEDTAK